MLVAAAAAAWGVPAAEIAVAQGVLTHKSGRAGRSATSPRRRRPARRAEGRAAQEPRPTSPTSARPSSGSTPKPRSPASRSTPRTSISTAWWRRRSSIRRGSAASRRRSTRARAQSVKGFLDAKIVPQGVAVYATGTWPAFKAKGLIKVEWDEDKAEKRGSAELLAEYRRLADSRGLVARNEGDVDAALAGAAKTVEAEFAFPYLAHAAMEPMNAVVKFDGDTVKIWSGSQAADNRSGRRGRDFRRAAGQGGDRHEIRRRLVRPPGGAERRLRRRGRRWRPRPGASPIRSNWSGGARTTCGRLLPAALSAPGQGRARHAGNLVAWKHVIVGQSIIAGTPFEKVLVKDGVDHLVEGVNDMPYAIPNCAPNCTTTKLACRCCGGASVGHTHTAYVVETMMDQLAAKAGKDPVEFRLALLKDKPRHAGVLKLAAEKAGWTSPPPPGVFRGVAVHESFHTYRRRGRRDIADKGGRRRRSSASSAPSIAASPSIRTSSRRRWRAASASASARRCATPSP